MKHENIKIPASSSSSTQSTLKTAKILKPRIPSKKAKSGCSCKCQCGFYPPDTELAVLYGRESIITGYGDPGSTSTIQTLSPSIAASPAEIRESIVVLNDEDQKLLNVSISSGVHCILPTFRS